MQSIKQWLYNPRSYEIGLALYHVYGEDRALKAMFDQGESPYRLQRLVKELKAISDSCTVTEVIIPQKEEKPIVVNVAQPVSKYDPPEVQVKAEADPYRETWIPFYEQMKYLQHNLLNAKDETERGVMAFEILRLEQVCIHYWTLRQYYADTGEKLADNYQPEVEQVVDVNSLRKKLTNYRSYRTKAKKKGNMELHDQYDALIKGIENTLGI